MVLVLVLVVVLVVVLLLLLLLLRKNYPFLVTPTRRINDGSLRRSVGNANIGYVLHHCNGSSSSTTRAHAHTSTAAGRCLHTDNCRLLGTQLAMEVGHLLHRLVRRIIVHNMPKVRHAVTVRVHLSVWTVHKLLRGSRILQ